MLPVKGSINTCRYGSP